MNLQCLRALIGSLLIAIGLLGCNTDVSDEMQQPGQTEQALAAWAQGNFSQVLRVNAAESTVRNICELTIPLSSYKPLTFTGGGSTPTSVGWAGSAVVAPGFSANGCTTYPCEVVARWQTSGFNSSTQPCQVSADDGVSRLTGSSSGTALTAAGQPTSAIIFNQDVKIGSSGSSISGSCVLRQSAELAAANVTNFGIYLNGIQEVNLPGPTAIGNLPWPSSGPSVPFGSITVGAEPTATRLKHVTARKEQLVEGDRLLCAGQFNLGGTPVYSVNVSGAPASSGISLARGATGWTCSATAFGSGDGCDCDCGIVDPDCTTLAGCGADPSASQQIAAVIAAPDGVGLLPIEGALVTYTKPALGTEPAGFFLQATQQGPAIFVAVDPATLPPPPVVGDKVSLTVTSLATVNGLKQVTAVTGFSRESSGNSIVPLVLDVTTAPDLVTNLAGYESQVISFTGTISSAFTNAGFPQVAAMLVTSGVNDPNLRIRMPETVRAELDLQQGCSVTVNYGVMWRFNAVAEPSTIYSTDYLDVSCPAPTVVSAIATSATEVLFTFSRQIDPASVLADGSQFTFNNGLTASAATASGNTVTVTTSAQSPGIDYTGIVDNTITDTYGTGLGIPDSAMFSGYEAPAVLRITEVNANITGSCDLIELRVISGGLLNGLTLFERTAMLHTFNEVTDVQVATGDHVVIHVNGGNIPTCNPFAVNETTAMNQYPAAQYFTNFDTAWDYYSSDTGLAATDNVIQVKDAFGNIQDAVFLTDDPTGTAAADTETAAAEVAAASEWTMVGGGVPPGGFIDDNFCAHAVLDLNATSTTTMGLSIQRVTSTDTNTMSDWGMSSATWGFSTGI